MALTLRPGRPLAPFELHFHSVGATGTRIVWAPDERSARQLLHDFASCFGIPHENPQIGRAIPLQFAKDGP